MLTAVTMLDKMFPTAACRDSDDQTSTIGLLKPIFRPTLRCEDISCFTIYPLGIGPAHVSLPAERLNLVVALQGSEILVRKNGATIFDGFLPPGAVCGLAPGRIVVAEPKEHGAFLVFSVPVSHQVMHHTQYFVDRGARRLEDFNLRWDESHPKLVALSEAAHGTAPSLTRQYVEQVIALAAQPSRARKLAGWRLRRVNAHVRTNIDLEHSLHDLAAIAGLSRMHFAAQFKAATCLSPHEFVVLERIKSAQALLLSTEDPLVDIALCVGFKNQAHFSTVFKRLTQMTPAAFRHRAQGLIAQKGSRLCRDTISAARRTMPAHGPFDASAIGLSHAPAAL